MARTIEGLRKAGLSERSRLAANLTTAAIIERWLSVV